MLTGKCLASGHHNVKVVCKGENELIETSYITFEISYMIHTWKATFLDNEIFTNN